VKSILKEVDAVRIFPIHTENAELFGKFTRGLRSKVVPPEKGRDYEVWPREIYQSAMSLGGFWSAFI
jgi:hypothetical protein